MNQIVGGEENVTALAYAVEQRKKRSVDILAC